jgi:ribosomal protein L19
VVAITYLHSLSSLKGNTFTGLVTQTRKLNSLNATFNLLFRFCGVQAEMQVKVFSPLLSDFKLVKKGSGNLPSKLGWIAEQNLTKENLQKAQFKKRSIKRRKDEKVRQRQIGQTKNKKLVLDSENDPLLD